MSLIFRYQLEETSNALIFIKELIINFYFRVRNVGSNLNQSRINISTNSKKIP